MSALTRRLERIEPKREPRHVLMWRDAADTDEVMQAKIDGRLKEVGATRGGDVEVHVLRWGDQ
jgi:hypothetical protein